MPIEAKCPGCERLLRVADEHAGKQARCPVCNTIYAVPERSTASLPANSAVLAGGEIVNLAPGDEILMAAEAVASSPEQCQPLDTSQWFMKTPEGQTFGPATRADLDRWVAEGRVTADCELRADDGPWRSADQVYPVLRAPPAYYAPAPATSPASAYPSGVAPTNSGQLAAGASRNAAYAMPHRGGLILAMGLMGFVSGCPILSIMAWVMGNGDLREMREGRMDPEGQGLTQAGYVLGMILSILWILAAVIGMFVVLLVAAAGK